MADQPDNDIDKLVANRLREAGLKFAREKAIGGLAPDFIVYAPDGRQFIVETRLWDFPGQTSEASRQAQHYQDAAKVDGAFVVIPGLKRNLPSKGVVTLDGLIPALQAEIHSSKSHSNPMEATKVDKLIFAAMPFAPQYEDVFFVAMSHAAEQVGQPALFEQGLVGVQPDAVVENDFRFGVREHQLRTADLLLRCGGLEVLGRGADAEQARQPCAGREAMESGRHEAGRDGVRRVLEKATDAS